MTMTDVPKNLPSTKKAKAQLKKDLAPKKLGRPTLLDDNMATAIIALLSRGNYRKTVAEFVGIKPDTIEAWVAKGDGYMAKRDDGEALDDEEQMFAEFALGVAQAEARSEIDVLARIDAAGVHDWRAAAWQLERTKPDRFGKIDRSEVQLNQNITVDPGELSRKIQSLVAKELEIKASGGLEAEEGTYVDAEVVDDVDSEEVEDWDEPVGT